MNLIFLGPPGAGKGTIAQLITGKLGILQISTGDLLRAEIKAQTLLGKKADECIKKGELVPDDLVINILKKRIAEKDCKKGFILDGFPRTIPQAEALDKANIKIDKVINFTLPEKIIIQRLSGRRTCKNCNAIYNVNKGCVPQPKNPKKCDKCGGELFQRDDDKPDAIKNRLKTHKEKTEPLIKFYKEKGILRDVESSNTDLDVIVQNTLKIIES